MLNVMKYSPSQYIIELTGIILDITFSMKQKCKNKRCSKRVSHCVYTIYAQPSMQFEKFQRSSARLSTTISSGKCKLI